MFSIELINHQSPKFYLVILPKKVKSFKNQKILTYKDMFQLEIELTDTEEDLKKGYIAIENDSLEIKNATISMLNVIDNNVDFKNEKENQMNFEYI